MSESAAGGAGKASPEIRTAPCEAQAPRGTSAGQASDRRDRPDRDQGRCGTRDAGSAGRTGVVAREREGARGPARPWWG